MDAEEEGGFWRGRERGNNKMSQEAKRGGRGVGWAVRCILMLSPFNLLACKHTLS